MGIAALLAIGLVAPQLEPVTVDVPKGKRYLTFVSADPANMLPSRLGLEISAAGNWRSTPVSEYLAPGATLYVYDGETGNVAKIHRRQFRNGQATLSRNDFKYVGVVTVAVTYKGKPVEGATVTLRDRERAVTRTQSHEYTATFLFVAVAPGRVTATVKYRTTDGKPAPPITRTVVIPLERKGRPYHAGRGASIDIEVPLAAPLRRPPPSISDLRAARRCRASSGP